MNRLIKYFSLLIVLLISSGCVKDETVMNINKDKSVELVINLGYPINSQNKLTLEEIKEKVGDDGYFIDSYHDNKYVGYSLSKEYSNINDISSSSVINPNLAEIINGNFDDSQLFTVKKGFFKNTYTANFNFDFKKIYNYKIVIELYALENNINCDQIHEFLNSKYGNNDYVEIRRMDFKTAEEFQNFNDKLSSLNSNYSQLPTIIINDKVFTGNSSETNNAIVEYMNDLINNPDYELTYKVNIPFKIKNSNESTKNGNTLVWNLNYSDVNEIKYSFEIFKIGSIILIIFIIVMIIITVFLIKIIRLKIKMDRQKFVMKNSDISNIIPDDSTDENSIMSISDIINK